MLLGVLRHYTDSESGLAYFNDRELNSIYMNTLN